MKERPILFNSEMIRAVLAGRKTQTRRVIRNLPDDAEFFSFHPQGEIAWFRDSNGMQVASPKCPYGWIGDHLWVRETWGEFFLDAPGEFVVYRADGERDKTYMAGGRWRPSIHMPRWASRITLEVTGVRVERVQDISEDDAIAEGIEPHFAAIAEMSHGALAPEGEFAHLWDSINARRGYSWSSNPWVWVVEFTHAVQ